MEPQQSSRVLIAAPPALNWDVLSRLVHLSNLEAMPLPMALSARSGNSKGTVDDPRSALESRTKQSRFFSISRRGRTVDDLAHQLDDLTSRSNRHSPISKEPDDDEGDATRLPNYLSNPFAEALHAEIKSAQEASAAARRRKSHEVRRKSSVFNAAFQAALVSLSNVEEEPREFRPSTFTRHGLSFAKMRALESQYVERERQVRKMLDEQQGNDAQPNSGTAAAQPQQLLPAPPPPPQLALSFRSTKVLEGTVSQITPPPPPRTPRGHIVLMERADHHLRLSRVHHNHIESSNTGMKAAPKAAAVEEVDWQASARLRKPHVPQPSSVRHGADVAEPSLATALVIPPVEPPSEPSTLMHSDVHPPSMPSPRSLAHPMFRRGPLKREKPTTSSARPEDIVCDERTSAKGYRPNALRELGCEIKLSPGTPQ